MNYKEKYYQLLAFLIDLQEEIETDENKYLLKLNCMIKENDL